MKWGVLDNSPPRPTYHLSSSPWKVRQSHRGILQPVLTSLPQSVIVWELGALRAFCSDPKDPSYNTHTRTHNPLGFLGSSITPQMVKKLPAMQEIRVQSLGWEDPSGEGHGNPLQYSCLENLTVGCGVAAGVARNRT